MRLLVSVRNLAELKVAASRQVDIIDLKEPANGSLGSVNAQTVAAANEWARNSSSATAQKSTQDKSVPTLQSGKRPHLSLAMGELIDFPGTIQPPTASLDCFHFAKVGLAGMGHRSDWNRQWLSWANYLPKNLTAVLVAYADHYAANSPPLAEVVAFAIRHRVSFLLLDTHQKRGRSLFDEIPMPALQAALAPFRRTEADAATGRAPTSIALAGSLRLEHLPYLAKLSPEIMAVRGAVCDGNQREQSIEPSRIEELQRQMKANSMAKF